MSTTFFSMHSIPEREWWREMDSNHRRVTPTDLQSVAFGHSAISPQHVSYMELAIGLEPTTPGLQNRCSTN